MFSGIKKKLVYKSMNVHHYKWYLHIRVSMILGIYLPNLISLMHFITLVLYKRQITSFFTPKLVLNIDRKILSCNTGTLTCQVKNGQVSKIFRLLKFVVRFNEWSVKHSPLYACSHFTLLKFY